MELEKKLTDQQKLQRTMDRVEKDISSGGGRFGEKDREKLREIHSQMTEDVKSRLNKLPVSLG